MDRLTNIENALASVLGSIAVATVLPSGYVYYNTVGGVNVDDEAVIGDINNYPIIDIDSFRDGIVEDGQQLAYRFMVPYTLRCGVVNEQDTQTPRRDINKKMNEIFSDVQYAISANPKLQGTCDLCEIKYWRREYTENGSVIRAGDLIITVEITYTSSRLNPNNNCSY